MFLAKNLVFTELHKTGGSHILKCLQSVMEGDIVGKHNRVPPHLRNLNVIGSIRNPWDWYVSLWSFGCAQNGNLYRCTTKRFNYSYYLKELNKELGKKWLSPSEYLKQIYSDAGKPVRQWQDCYQDSRNPSLFQAWLKMLLNPNRRFDLGEGYGFSPVSFRYGLLTYRYLKLFTCIDDQLHRSLPVQDPHLFQKLVKDKTFINHFIRNEHLESDLIYALSRMAVPLKNNFQKVIEDLGHKKTNKSERLGTEYYYDQESIDLVLNKDKTIIDLHDYHPPSI